MDECVRMPVCEHIVPMHRPCELCGRKNQPPKEREKPLEEVILRLKKEIRNIEFQVADFVGKVYFNKQDADGAIDGLARSLHVLQLKVEGMEQSLSAVREIELDAEKALSLFVKKAHELKKIDAKRDDVINSLCQKITAMEATLNQRGDEHANTR